MALVFGVIQVSQRLGLEDPEYTNYLRLSYGLVQLITAAIIAYIYVQVKGKEDKTVLVYNDQKNPFDPKDVEVVKTTVGEYDMTQVRTFATQTLTGNWI